jgi:hypothetical protein
LPFTVILSPSTGAPNASTLTKVLSSLTRGSDLCARPGASRSYTPLAGNLKPTLSSESIAGSTALSHRFARSFGASGTATSMPPYSPITPDTTGFAPFKLLYGRHPTVPEDLLFGIPSTQSFTNEEKYAIYCSQQQQAEAYRMMLKNQTVVATRNRLCRETFQTDVIFNPGEQVLYWQPASGKAKSSEPSHNDDALLRSTRTQTTADP